MVTADAVLRLLFLRRRSTISQQGSNAHHEKKEHAAIADRHAVIIAEQGIGGERDWTRYDGVCPDVQKVFFNDSRFLEFVVNHVLRSHQQQLAASCKQCSKHRLVGLVNDANRRIALLTMRMMHDTDFVFPKKDTVVARSDQNVLSVRDRRGVRLRRVKVDGIDALVISDEGEFERPLPVDIPHNQLGSKTAARKDVGLGRVPLDRPRCAQVPIQ